MGQFIQPRAQVSLISCRPNIVRLRNSGRVVTLHKLSPHVYILLWSQTAKSPGLEERGTKTKCEDLLKKSEYAP